MFEVLSARLIFFILFSARFSFNVLPCFFVLDFCGDLSDMATLRQANVETTPPWSSAVRAAAAFAGLQSPPAA
jgi:hypothetical protein